MALTERPASNLVSDPSDFVSSLSSVCRQIVIAHRDNSLLSPKGSPPVPPIETQPSKLDDCTSYESKVESSRELDIVIDCIFVLLAYPGWMILFASNVYFTPCQSLYESPIWKMRRKVGLVYSSAKLHQLWRSSLSAPDLDRFEKYGSYSSHIMYLYPFIMV